MATRHRLAFLGAAGASLVAVMVTAAAPFPATAPTGKDDDRIAKWVATLSAADPDAWSRGLAAVEDLPPVDLPLVEALAVQPGLPAPVADGLRAVLPRARQRAKLARRAADRLASQAAWMAKVGLAAYDRDGHANPKWDAAARSFLTLGVPSVPPTGGAVNVGKQMRLALDAGCDDPDVLTYAALHVTGTRPETIKMSRVTKLLEQADHAAADGRVGPLSKVIIDGRLIRSEAARFPDGLPEERKTALSARLDDMIARYHDLLKMPGLPPHVAVTEAQDVIRAGDAVGRRSKAVFDAVYPPLEALLPHDPDALYVKGLFYVNFAWKARGDGYANTVKQKGWKDMAARLDVAGEALTRAWGLDPQDAGPPTEMITVELGQGKGRDVMETWFQRAMAANPDDREACTAKLYYLEPKWYGSPAEMLAFGRECVAGGNWRGKVPFVLVDAHVSLAEYATDKDDYWLGTGVWDDVRSVYTEYLRRYPDDAATRGYYARFAYKCHQWKVLNDQFNILGDHVDHALFGNGTTAALTKARHRAAQLADKPEAQGE